MQMYNIRFGWIEFILLHFFLSTPEGDKGKLSFIDLFNIPPVSTCLRQLNLFSHILISLSENAVPEERKKRLIEI